MSDGVLETIVLINLHASILVLFLSLVMFVYIGNEYNFIKGLKNGRKQLVTALLGVFVVMIFQSLNYIFHYFFSDCKDSSIYLFGLIINTFEIIVVGNFVATKWKLLISRCISKCFSKKGR